MAKAPKAKAGVGVFAVGAFPYPAATAFESTSYYIDNPADQETSFQQIAEHIQDAAQVHHQFSLTLRASNGVINRQDPAWIEIEDALEDAGYEVRTSNQTGTAEIAWD